MMYFHGNAEDLFTSLGLLQQLQHRFKCSLLAMEYPGYGFFSHKIKDREIDKKTKYTCSNQKIRSCAITCFEHAVKPKSQGGLGFTPEQIIVFGRSMGSGPTCTLGARFRPRCLVLMSAYTTIKDVAKNVVGKFLAFAVAEHFNNRNNMASVRCPVLFIHG